jgi:hypothetical protein
MLRFGGTYPANESAHTISIGGDPYRSAKNAGSSHCCSIPLPANTPFVFLFFLLNLSFAAF